MLIFFVVNLSPYPKYNDSFRNASEADFKHDDKPTKVKGYYRGAFNLKQFLSTAHIFLVLLAIKGFNALGSTQFNIYLQELLYKVVL